MKTVSEILSALDALAPPGTAEDWDNVGLIAGNPQAKVSGAVVSIDLTEKAIEKAKDRGFGLIVTHHPCIFPRQRGMSRIQPPSLVYQAIEAGIAVAAYHTNFDQCALEVVSAVADGLGCKLVGRLVDKPSGSLLKLVVFVPETHHEQVRAAICEAGAGQIGNYDICTFATHGLGTFRGSKDSQPFLGKPGELETAEEVRLETILPRGLKSQVLRALLQAHPYEEVAFDFYPVEQGPSGKGIARGLGYGFHAEFTKPKPFAEIAKDVRKLFDIDGFVVTDPPPTRIRKVAFVAGKGASFVPAAYSLGCELFITGEAGYHTALDGMRHGMAVMELGHRESEKFFLITMEGWLKAQGIRTIGLNVPTQRIRG